VVAWFSTTVVLLLRTKRQSPRPGDPLPNPAIVDFLLNVSYDKSIRYPFPAVDLTAAERALVGVDQFRDCQWWQRKRFPLRNKRPSFRNLSCFQSMDSSSSQPNGTQAWVTPLATNTSGECTWVREPRVQCSGGNIDALDLTMVVDLGPMHGPIARDLGLLTRLTSLVLDDNKLSGPLPSEFGILSCLTYFSVKRNIHGGSVPAELVTWVDIEQLFLTFNQFNGSIPTIFST
jgi:hypothetical protein